MTNEELLRELKINKVILKIIKITGSVSISGAIVCDYEFVKQAYNGYINHREFLNEPVSVLYLGLITFCLSEYVTGRLLYDYLIEENKNIKCLIKY